jgi:ubiquinone/menaquinone biosynthesis C-methylase UbiE
LTSLHDRYQRIAPFYDLLDLPFEYRRYRPIRPRLFQGLSGRVLDAGVGTGRNMPFYPPGTEVVGIDLSEAMLARAERRGAAVATFLFCVLPEELQAPALSEVGRVVKPGGTIRLLEYQRPSGAFRRAIARLWEPWMAWAYGAGFDRRTEEHVAETDLEIVDSTFVVDDLIKLLSLKAPQ